MLNPDSKPYRTLSQKVLQKNPWFQLRQDEVIFPGGKTGLYNVINIGSAAWIVPVLKDGRVVLIRQYRYPIDDWCIEVPAGGIPTGGNPETTARRELAEEIGGQAEKLLFIGKYWTIKGIGDEMAYLYLAEGVILGKPHHEDSEVIHLQIVSPQTAIHMARTGQVSDAASALALLLCEQKLLNR